MSNNQSSDQFKIPGALAVFVLLLLSIGVVLLATSNIGAGSAIRASNSPTPPPTVNAFDFKGYHPFTSADGVLKLEYPESWNYLPNPSGDYIYVFSPDTSLASGVAVQISVVSRADLVRGMQGTTAQSTPREVLTAAFTGTSNSNQKIEDVKAGNLSGARTILANALDDKGQPSGQALDTTLLALDNTNFLLLRAAAPTARQGSIKPVVDKILGTIQIDTTRIGAKNPVVVPTTDAHPTVVATQAATKAATAHK